jgi:O-antigen/teichoic acid export membrane protein
LIYGGAYLAGRVVTFLLLPLLATVLIPQDFGAVDLTIALGSFALVSVALEIAQGLARSYPEVHSDHERARFAGAALAFGLVAYSLFAAFALGAILLFRPALPGRVDGPIILAAGVSWVVATGLLAIVQVPLRYGLRPTAYAVSNVSLAVSSAITVLVLVVGLRAGPAGLLAGQTLGTGVAVLVSAWLARPRPILVLDRLAIAEFLRFSIPLVPASLAVVATAWMDRLAIASSLTLADVGQYGVAVRVSAVVGLLVVGFQAAVTPLTYTFHREPATPEALARVARLYAGFAVLFLAGLAWIGPELVRVMAGDRYTSAVPILPVVAAVPLLAGFANLAPGLVLLRSTRLMALIAIIGAALTTVLNFTLVPRYGILAAAWSSAIGTAAALTLTVTYGQKRYRIPWEKVALAAAAATGIGIGVLTPALQASGAASLPVRTAMFLVVVGVIVLARVVQSRDIRAAWATLAWRLRPQAGS